MLDYKLLNMTEEIEMAKIRKLLSLLLCLVMVLSFFPAAYAEGENEGTVRRRPVHEIRERSEGSPPVIAKQGPHHRVVCSSTRRPPQ